MSSLVEITGHSEALDAEWFCKLCGKDVTSLSFRDVLGPVGDLIDLGQLIFGKYRLMITYDKQESGLHNMFSSDERVGDYVARDPEEAFIYAIKRVKPYIYSLNIASVENFGAFKWKGMRSLLERQLNTYMPIIQKFMADALTGTLEAQKTVK